MAYVIWGHYCRRCSLSTFEVLRQFLEGLITELDRAVPRARQPLLLVEQIELLAIEWTAGGPSKVDNSEACD